MASTVPATPLLSRALLLVFLASFGANASFYLLLSTVPLYAASQGASDLSAGLATGALMGATVATELAVPRLVARFGYRRVFATGLLLLGLPALALGTAHSIASIAALCVVRGIGFAIVVVAGSALVAALVPPTRRGEGLGLYGIVVGLPAVAGLPLGVWLAARVGYEPVFVAGAVAALGGLLGLAGVPRRSDVPNDVQSLGVAAALRTPTLLRPAVAFATTATAAGAIVTFLPLAMPKGDASTGDMVAVALLAQAVTATLTRWWAGHHGDRHGAARLLGPSIVVAAIGLLALLAIDRPVAVIVGMLLFGAGFGVAQNASLSLMLDRVSPASYDTVSAVWNMAYDAGLGLGGVGLGMVATRTGYPVAFAATAVVMLATLGALAATDASDA